MGVTITVKKLKEILIDLPDDTLVVLSQDNEGNSFSPVITYTKEAIYVPDRHPWQQGQVYTPDDPQFDQAQGRRALILWPTH